MTGDDETACLCTGVYRMLTGEQIKVFFWDKQKYASMMRLALLYVLYILGRLQ
jgi:hypothetical protein